MKYNMEKTHICTSNAKYLVKMNNAFGQVHDALRQFIVRGRVIVSVNADTLTSIHIGPVTPLSERNSENPGNNAGSLLDPW